MKIGIVLYNAPGYSETFFRSKIKGLQKNGMEVFLFCYNNKDHFSLCPVIESPKVSFNPFVQAWRFLRELFLLLPYLRPLVRYIRLERKEGTDWSELPKKIYLNTHLLKVKMDWLHFGFATMALGKETVAKAIGAKMAVSFRGFDMTVYPLKNPGCYHLLWKYIDKVHSISNHLVILAKKHGMPSTFSSTIIPPAIDYNTFFAENHYKSTTEVLNFLTVGRLHWIKGYVSTLEALVILKEQGIKFHYKIIGEGEEYERIAFAAYQLGLKENVAFLGKLNPKEVREELQIAHIYLQYSLQEGFCNAVLEAQAMGKLCIVSDAEGLAENVLHEKTGWVVPKNAPELLAEQINNVLVMDEQAKRTISKNAVERVNRKFNLEKQQREFVEFYE